MNFRHHFLVLGMVMLPVLLTAQSSVSTKKYPSLFWEITGNGLSKPSYLFGTMHVSSKMVFNLSDSFYHALRNTDAVALELNPEVWQDQMFRLQKAQVNLASFSRPSTMDFLNEKSFQLQNYEEELKRALNEEPTVVNSLLYRSYQARADFEENTYLDLYIYQTGRKLGKQPAGVEDYMESERLMLEAYADMAKEKKKKSLDFGGESMFDIEQKLQDAYRTGDLDLLDSLQRLTETSAAFNEKFLYVRNEIQANSIDTILKNRSLFVGVGAAHLPGKRGVIELLRQKGYQLRPIFMQGRDAAQKEKIDKLKVPVVFKPVTISDGMISLQLPGQLYKREDARTDSWQYADMNNGSYYMLTRIKTHGGLIGVNEQAVLKKVDSVLYENIPGKILKKTAVSKNGFNGFDITNKTRRGDLQRYQVLVTPYEVLVFKMSGNDTYVDGKEADVFFNSIAIKNAQKENWMSYQPGHGGFTVMLPQEPVVTVSKYNSDKISRWNYEAIDPKTGNAFMIWKKTLYNFSLIEEDTFGLALMEESFQRSDLIQKRLSRKMSTKGTQPTIEATYLMKDGGHIQTKGFVDGPHYYFLAARYTNKPAEVLPFLSSFKLAPFVYHAPSKYSDSILNLEVMTAVQPNIDTMLRSWIEKASGEDVNAAQGNFNYWPKNKTGVFKSNETGEAVFVQVETFPKYFYIRDTVKFWSEKLDEKNITKDLVIRSKEAITAGNNISGYNLVLSDTNSSRSIMHKYILRGNHLFKFSTVSDTTGGKSEFLKSFFTTVKPINNVAGTSVFENKLNLFFEDYNSEDSLVKKQAQQAIANVYFGKEGLNKIVSTIQSLKYADKDYLELKRKFINELGYIDDTSAHAEIASTLKKLYNETADTAYFQNTIIIALARLKSEHSFAVLKNILVQDPPVFENSYEYGRMFTHFTDTISLAKMLFPELLQLAAVEDYRLRINTLLRQLVDSGWMKATDYESYFAKLHFDATIQLKKQLVRDEKRMEQDTRQEENVAGITLRFSSGNTNGNNANGPLYDYAGLLMPFYNTKESVPRFFSKLLQSKDPEVQMNTAMILIKNNIAVPDTLLENLASKDEYRARLLARLEKIKRPELFPKKYKSQQFITTSLLLNDKNLQQFAEVKLVNKKMVEVQGKKGLVYLYKYKSNKEDEWKMGISGLQPMNGKEVSSNKMLVKMTDKKLKNNEPEQDQFDTQVKQLIYAQHKSSRNFFIDHNTTLFQGSFGDIED